MKKSNIGISTNLFAALIYFTAFFSGWLGLLLVAGYTLLKEEDEWLKKTAVKALVLTAAFTVVPSIIGLIPDSIGVLNSFLDSISKIAIRMTEYGIKKMYLSIKFQYNIIAISYTKSSKNIYNIVFTNNIVPVINNHIIIFTIGHKGKITHWSIKP